jgi:SSS family solute:Na+ symporter
MAATLHLAVWEGAAGVLVTLLLTMVTRPAPEQELEGLVYKREPAPDRVRGHWFRTPEFLAIVVLTLFLILNVIFR